MFNNRTTGGDNTVEVDGENWNYYCNLFPPPSPLPSLLKLLSSEQLEPIL